jgi:hypothetical protein
MRKDLVYNATLRRKYGKYASFMENIHRNNWTFNAYTSIIWDSLLTIVLVGLWCKVMLVRFGHRITAYQTVAVRALDDKEIAHKLNIFLGTVGSVTVLVVIIIFVLILSDPCPNNDGFGMPPIFVVGGDKRYELYNGVAPAAWLVPDVVALVVLMGMPVYMIGCEYATDAIIGPTDDLSFSRSYAHLFVVVAA